MGYLQIGKMGLESFTKYGKLIGTGKNNGIKVFEQLVNGKRILTSVDKNGEVRKTITTQQGAAYSKIPSVQERLENDFLGQVKVTTVQNHITGEELMHTYTLQHKYDRIVRSNANEWESFTASSPYKEQSITAYDKGNIEFSSYDLQNQKGIKVRKYGPFINCESFQLKNGQKGDYEFKDGVSIPNFLNGNNSGVKPGRITNIYLGEENLASQVLGYFDSMFAKLVGYKPKS